jgi:hypothetical protein
MVKKSDLKKIFFYNQVASWKKQFTVKFGIRRVGRSNKGQTVFAIVVEKYKKGRSVEVIDEVARMVFLGSSSKGVLAFNRVFVTVNVPCLYYWFTTHRVTCGMFVFRLFDLLLRSKKLFSDFFADDNNLRKFSYDIFYTFNKRSNSYLNKQFDVYLNNQTKSLPKEVTVELGSGDFSSISKDLIDYNDFKDLSSLKSFKKAFDSVFSMSNPSLEEEILVDIKRNGVNNNIDCKEFK